MKVAIHQPQFMPWLGYFHKMACCDIFVILDDVQYKRREWQNRNRIKSPNGLIWLTVPVIYRLGQAINETIIDKTKNWQKEHKNGVMLYYSKAKHFKDIYPRLLRLWETPYEKFIDVAMDSIEIIRDVLNIKTKLIFSSTLNIDKKKTERLIEVCKRLGANTYLSGQGAKDYLDIEKFKTQGIKVVWQDFKHPIYPQLWGEFAPNLSAIDFILNCGGGEKDMLLDRRKTYA